MSFVRLIYLSSLIGGWSAFLGWLITELLFGRYIDRESVNGLVRTLLAVLMATLVAVPIGGGISAASNLNNLDWPSVLKRLLIGFIGGLIGGLIGSLLGACIFWVVEKVPFLAFLGRILGWTLIGVGIGIGLGAMEGLFERSLKKLRNGVIGGCLGGFLGGFFFVPVDWIIGSPMSSRAVAFVLLGLSIGLFIGLAQVILKEAWLTVEQGFRPGRQMILGQNIVTMGTSEKSSLIFIAYGAKGVEPIHLRIAKQADGRYVLEDNRSRTGTFVNNLPITGPIVLNDGDTIQLGVNVVRFRERVHHGMARPQMPLPPPSAPVPAPIPSTAIQTTPASPAPVPAKPPAPVGAMQPMPAKPAAIQPMPGKLVAPPPMAPKPAPKPVPAQAMKPAAAPLAAKPAVAPMKPAAAVGAQEGRCPICDKKIVGVPGKRRCDSCFTTF